MSIIVQKFGGTTTRSSKSRKRMYAHIENAVKKSKKVVVVVSAMGRFDDPYATDTLYSLVDKTTMSAQELDRLASIGETLSVLVVKSELKKLGYRVETIENSELGLITDDLFQNATIQSIDGKKIIDKLKSTDIVVCPGFQGYTADGRITTLGRDSSDLSAVAIAVACKSDEVEIYSDVNGIYTADPRIVPDAIKLDHIGYSEMLELSSHGAKVLNRRCVQMAAMYNIKIHCRSTFLNTTGTYVLGDEEIMKENLNSLVISGVTGSQNEARVTLVGVDATNNSAAMLFQKIAEENINITVFNQAMVGGGKMDISLIFKDEDIPGIVNICNELKQPLKAKRTIVRGNIGKVSVVGVGVKTNPGMFHKVYDTLTNNNINVEMTSCSEINISCFIDRDDVKHAQAILHETFLNNH